MKGLLVTFEGIDGCGKSTQVELARRMLSQKGIACLVTREPGGTPTAERIRDILLSPDNAVSDECEVLLYFAARAQHVREKIVPALDKGVTVLCDRFALATFAYQGYGRGIPMRVLKNMNRFATGGVEPALTFVFDIGVDAAFLRLKKTGKRPDRLEASGRKFYKKVRKGYRELARKNPGRIILLNGGTGIDDLADIVGGKIIRKLRMKQ
jgi:dTMP kinase